MSSLAKIINSFIIGENNFCCICFNTNTDSRINDEVTMNINETVEEIDILDILKSVLGEDMQEYVKIFGNICGKCVRSIAEMYMFVRKSAYNAEVITKALDGISTYLEYSTNEQINSNSLFITLSKEDFTAQHFYDSKKVTSTKAALKRLQTKFEKKYPAKMKRYDNPVDIKTSDMLFDPQNPLIRKCKECLKVFSATWNLRNHFLRVHAPKVFQCLQCPRTFGSASILATHETYSHCSIVCSQCGKTFGNRQSLGQHEKGHNLKIVCSDCGRTYKNMVTFKHHIELNVCKRETRANPSDAKYTCDYCNKKYTQKMSLRVHIQYEHGNYKPHICEWCDKKFWAQSRLKAHIVKHTRDKNFSCSICKGKFVSKESLLYHTRIHTGERPYKCPECPSSFLSASRRSQHVKRNHLGGTLECDICSSTFTSHAYLHKHKKQHNLGGENEEKTKEKVKILGTYQINNNS